MGASTEHDSFDGSDGPTLWLPFPRKTRRFSHVVYETLGTPVPVKAVSSLGIRLLYVLLGIVLAQMLFRSSSSVGNSREQGVNLERTRVIYSPGWRGGPIELAGPNAKYLPRGEHIMIDVYEADPEWLNDVDGMMAGVVKVIKDAGLHIIFSAGFQLAPQGISITITIEESHLTIHTWPEHKAALVDIFTCGSSPLLPVLPILVKELRTTMDHVKWSLHKRGDVSVTDLQEHVLKNRWQRKELLHHERSAVQWIDVWRAATEYDADNNPSDDPIRLYFNESLQASSADEHMLYEALVHPSFVTHTAGPSRVAVLGGDTLGATREALRYQTVTSVDVFVIDAAVPPIVVNHMPQLANCSFGWPGFSSCLMDPRVRLLPDWEVDGWKQHCSNPYDIVIIDLTKPESDILASSAVDADMSCVLADSGIVVARLTKPTTPQPVRRRIVGGADRLARRITSRFGATTTYLYTVFISSFGGEVTFSISCRDPHCNQRWNTTPELIRDTIKARIKQDAQPLRFFSDDVMIGFVSSS